MENKALLQGVLCLSEGQCERLTQEKKQPVTFSRFWKGSFYIFPYYPDSLHFNFFDFVVVHSFLNSLGDNKQMHRNRLQKSVHFCSSYCSLFTRKKLQSSAV